MTLSTFHDLKNLRGKKILLRVDLNCGISKRKVIESPRIKAHSDTIKFLLSKKAKVVVVAHQGLQNEDCETLKQHSKLLNKYVKVKFVNEIVGKKAWSAISSMKNGEALLLENVRFLKDEYSHSTNSTFVNFIKEAGFDYYVNDAFSVSHRNHVSMVAFPKIFPSAMGLVFEKELKSAEKLKSKLKNCLFVLGGAKYNDMFPLLKNKKILASGKLGNLLLISRGFNLGKENKNFGKDVKLLGKLKNYPWIAAPIDLAINVNGKRKEISINEFPQNYPVKDIGQETIKIFKEEISRAKAVFFKGSPGFFQHENFEKGTREILNAIANSPAFSVVAGGQGSDAIKKFKIPKRKFSYISLSGGSLVAYLAGEKLPGLEALKINSYKTR